MAGRYRFRLVSGEPAGASKGNFCEIYLNSDEDALLFADNLERVFAAYVVAVDLMTDLAEASFPGSVVRHVARRHANEMPPMGTRVTLTAYLKDVIGSVWRVRVRHLRSGFDRHAVEALFAGAASPIGGLAALAVKPKVPGSKGDVAQVDVSITALPGSTL
jgi:hypothetical protein